MNRDGHLSYAALTAATVSWQLDQPLWQRALSAGLALATASAADIDNTRWWQEIRQHLPWKGLRKPLNHRGLTHSWLIPVLLFKSQSDPAWTFAALVSGYSSHIIADAMFGKTGVPMILWFAHFGLRLPMGGKLEKTVAVLTTLYTPFVVGFGPASLIHALDWLFHLWG